MRTSASPAVRASSNMPSMPSPPLSDSGASPEVERVLPLLQHARVSNRTLRCAVTLLEESAFRSVLPRYCSPGLLPVSFAGPPLAVNAARQSAAQSGQLTMLSIPLASQMPSTLNLFSSDMNFIALDEPTPRFSYSPMSLVEPTLTPRARSSAPRGCLRTALARRTSPSPARAAGPSQCPQTCFARLRRDPRPASVSSAPPCRA
ncbi:hypothetical protein DFH11DRAFT_1590659 [Phellopilus nigrolimitatus]|nr:hypothetical protein DFH11DRAFT_1590659 [Phellopilus nigrolimitatus]